MRAEPRRTHNNFLLRRLDSFPFYFRQADYGESKTHLEQLQQTLTHLDHHHAAHSHAHHHHHGLYHTAPNTSTITTDSVVSCVTSTLPAVGKNISSSSSSSTSCDHSDGERKKCLSHSELDVSHTLMEAICTLPLPMHGQRSPPCCLAMAGNSSPPAAAALMNGSAPPSAGGGGASLCNGELASTCCLRCKIYLTTYLGRSSPRIVLVCTPPPSSSSSPSVGRRAGHVHNASADGDSDSGSGCRHWQIRAGHIHGGLLERKVQW